METKYTVFRNKTELYPPMDISSAREKLKLLRDKFNENAADIKIGRDEFMVNDTLYHIGPARLKK